MVTTFKQLAIGDTFKFAHPQSPWPGPWIKVSVRQYSPKEGNTEVKITVGTILVAVERLSKTIRDSYDLIRTWEDPDGHGFKLELFDTYQTDGYGKAVLGYRFYHGEALVFEGDDFHASPMHSIDGDETVGGLLSFPSLKPGDTDDEYFASYTEGQLAFANEWGETLGLYVEELEERRVPGHYTAFDNRAWDAAGLKDFGDFAECVTNCNQSEYGDDQLEGDWWYADDDNRTIYSGTFGNYNSPGASSYTFADVYENVEDFRAEVVQLEAMPEYA
jgi:hypothetical protein